MSIHFTLADLRKNADAGVPFKTGIDSSTPEGTFFATTKVLGITSTYLLEGEVDDPNARVLGRIEIHGTIGNARRVASAGSGLKGGYSLGSGGDEEVFAAMVRHAGR